jgi:hypothetical protein
MVAALFSAALLAAAAPQPSELRTFADWTVGCDNGRACHAVGLIPEDWPENGLTMSVRRGAEAAAPVAIAFDIGEGTGARRLAVDGQALGVELAVGADGMMAVGGDDAATVLGVLRGADTIQVTTVDNAVLGTVSLKGASAALLYMDEQQRRVGTATALVRPGSAAASAVPPPPPLPKVAAAPAAGGEAALAASDIAALRKRFGCDLEEVGGPDEQEVHPLGGGTTLVLLACGSGAYNVSMVPILIEAGGGAAGARPAPFDASEAWWEGEGKPMLVNAGFDPAQALLSSFAKGRGLGDCGTGRDYVWDGSRFRLVSQIEMGECRGSRDYIATWRAEVVRP